MSLLNNPFALVATFSLTIQFIVLFLLLYGYWLKRKLKFPQHGTVMSAALASHLALIFAIMVPAFTIAIVPTFVVPHVSGLTSLISLVHVPIGVAAVSLGVWLVFSWRRQGLKSCFKRKKIMVITMTVWLASLILGIALYAVLYWSALMG